MRNTLLDDLLLTFTAKEWQEWLLFLEADYFNRREELRGWPGIFIAVMWPSPRFRVGRRPFMRCIPAGFTTISSCAWA